MTWNFDRRNNIKRGIEYHPGKSIHNLAHNDERYKKTSEKANVISSDSIILKTGDGSLS